MQPGTGAHPARRRVRDRTRVACDMTEMALTQPPQPRLRVAGVPEPAARCVTHAARRFAVFMRALREVKLAFADPSATT